MVNRITGLFGTVNRSDYLDSLNNPSCHIVFGNLLKRLTSLVTINTRYRVVHVRIFGINVIDFGD